VEKSTPVPFVAPLITVPAAASVWASDPDTIPYSLWEADPICITIAPRHVFLDNLRIVSTPYDTDSDFAKVITPYSADHFDIFLRNADLLDAYPQLSDKIRHGFPLGNLDPISLTYAPPNLPSALEHDTLIQDYIASELAIGHFSGRFTQPDLEAKIGPFRSSPLQVAVKEEAPGHPKKFRVCRNLSYKGSMGRSVNDEIDAKDFPTRWGTAEQVANFVSLPSSFISATRTFYDLAVPLLRSITSGTAQTCFTSSWNHPPFNDGLSCSIFHAPLSCSFNGPSFHETSFSSSLVPSGSFLLSTGCRGSPRHPSRLP
jgi:hypothetical protein